MSPGAWENNGTWLDRVTAYGRMVRFSHTLFALPFALTAVVLAQRQHPFRLADLFWILVAMVAARSAAMGFNRLADRPWDAVNPRTAHRELPTGKLPVASALRFVLFFSGVFLLAAAMLGRLCFYLAPPVLLVLFGYSYTKRFTWLSHLYLGFAISLAPAGAWIAVTKDFSWAIGVLSAALMTWMAGFDILYACQDTTFDRRCGLYSIPARFGVRSALRMAAACHIVCFVLFASIYFAFEMTVAYLIAVGLIGMLLFIENRLVKPDDLSRIPVAFFHVNSVISLVLLAGVLTDEIVRRGGG